MSSFFLNLLVLKKAVANKWLNVTTEVVGDNITHKNSSTH